MIQPYCGPGVLSLTTSSNARHATVIFPLQTIAVSLLSASSDLSGSCPNLNVNRTSLKPSSGLKLQRVKHLCLAVRLDMTVGRPWIPLNPTSAPDAELSVLSYGADRDLPHNSLSCCIIKCRDQTFSKFDLSLS